MIKIFSFVILLITQCCFAKNIDVISTTSHLAAIAVEIGKPNVKLSVLIPPGICPGHYEVKPGDMKKLSAGGIFLYHGWEGFVEDVAKATSGTEAKMFKIDVPGSWLIPDIQIKAAEKIADVLKNIDPLNKKNYEKNLDTYKRKMQHLDKIVKDFTSSNNFSGIRVVCSTMQKDFLLYLGFDVIDCFGRDEEITPGLITKLITTIKNASVRLIISNLQSGTSTGRIIAERTGLPHVIISNFPGGFENTKTIESTVMHNLRILEKALKTHKE